MYYLAADLFVNRVAPTANYLYQMGTNSQGTSYGQGKIKWNAIGNVLMEKMNDDGIKYINDGISQSMYSYIYYRRPDGQLVRMGDGFQSSASLGARWNFSDADAILYLNAQYPDPYLQQELLNCLNSGVTLNPTEALVLYDVNTEPKPISELPLTRYLDSPNGEMIARTGWSIDTVDFSANDMIVDMKIQELMLNNHNHLDSGSFQIYYKGSLAVDSGTYGLYGGSHDLNYHKRGIAHNSILIRDPNVQEGVYNFWGQELSNDGGMDWVGWGALPDDITGETAETLKTPETMDNRPWINGEVLAHQFGPDLQVPDYTYLKGDLTGFYGYRAEDFNRSFVFFNFMNDLYPGALIVFDKITATDASYDKYFLLHSINEPVVNGNTTTIQRTENGYNGQLINTTLLPGEGNVNIEVVEGYEVFGTTYPEPLNGPTDEGGEWRIQVSPVADAETDLMLNVMQVSDAGVTPLPVTQIGSAQDPLVGAKIYDRIALFSTSGEEIEGTVSIPQAGSESVLKYFVADLKAGQWQVTDSDGKVIAVETASEDGHCIMFSAAPDKVYTLTPVSGQPEIQRPVWSDSSLQAYDISADALTLTWSGASDNSGIVNYLIYMDNQLIKSVSETSVTLTESDGLTPGQHIFKVEACNAAGYESNTGPSISVFVTQLYTITGTVTVKYSGAPAENAEVQAKTSGGTVIARTQTAADGSYTLKDVPSGEYQLAVTCANTVPATLSATVTDTDLQDQNVLLTPVLSPVAYSTSKDAFVQDGYTIENIFNGITVGEDRWSTYSYDSESGSTEYDPSKDAYAEIDLGNVYQVTGLDIVAYGANRPKFKVEISTDGIEYTEALPQFQLESKSGQWQECPFVQTSPARYLRI